MKRKVLITVSALLLSFGFLFNFSVGVSAADIPFTPLTLTEAAATSAFSDLKNRDPLWYQKDYFIYKYNSTLFAIAVIPKENGSKVIFDDTIIQDFDLDRVWVDARASTSSARKDYRYNISTGAYSTTVTTTVNGSFIVSGPTYYSYYTNMNLVNRTYDSEFFPNVIIDVPLTKPHLGLGYPNPDWLFQSGVSEEAYWLALGIDYQQIIADNAVKQTDHLEDIYCFLFSWDAACDSGNIEDSPFYDLTFFWTDLFNAISTFFSSFVTFIANIATQGINAISGVFNNVATFGTSIKTLFSYLPAPFNTISNLGIDISLGIALLKLGRMVFLKV